MVDALGNPLATDLTSKMFAHYRDKRLTGEIYFSEKWKKGASPVTINLEQSYLSSVFSELSRLANGRIRNPMENMRKFTIAEKEMGHGLPMSRSLNCWLIANVRTQFWQTGS